MVDLPKIDEMLSNLKSYATVLKGLATTSKELFLSNPDKIGNAKYNMVIAIESCIDIAHHIIASEQYRIPSDNADGFTILHEQRVIPEDLAERLRAMARFRNRLVHLYWRIDDERVWEYLQTGLGDMDRFTVAVASFVKTQP